MANGKANKKYDFDAQAQGAIKDEEKLKNLLPSGKYELKTESNIWHTSGNLAIEYESYNKPSGLAITEADYWAHELRTKDRKTTLAYFIFPTHILKKICNDLMDEGGSWTEGGENKAQEMVLLKLGELYKRLQNFSSEGDDIFLTRKQREASDSSHKRQDNSSQSREGVSSHTQAEDQHMPTAAEVAAITNEPPQEANRPIDKIRIGNVVASIWRNSSEKGDFYTTTFDRSYRDEAGAMKHSQSFSRGDLLELAKAADKAHDRILDLQRKNL